MTERERRADNKRRTEIAMMRLLIEQYPQQALDQLREMQSRAKTVSTVTTFIDGVWTYEHTENRS